MPLLDMLDGFFIPYPPVDSMFLICQDLCQCCCPTAAADDTEMSYH